MRSLTIALLFSNVVAARAAAATPDETVITEGDGKLTVVSLAPISFVSITEGDTKLTVEPA